MGSAELCPPGSEITTQNECNDALKWASVLGINLIGRQQVVSGSWSGVPHQCSYQASNDNAFHFNDQQTNNAPRFINGEFIRICKKGKGLLNKLKIILAMLKKCPTHPLN